MKAKRLKSMFMVLVLCSTLLAACGNKETEGGTQTTNADDKVVITMAWWGSQTRHDATVAVIEMYEEQNPHIDIQYEFYDFDGYMVKLNTLAPVDAVWDVFQIDNRFPNFISDMEPLDSYVESGLIDVSDTTESYLQTTTMDGQLWGISNGVNAYSIAYDPAILAEVGIAEPADNWTWADFEEMAMTIQQEKNIYGMSFMEPVIPMGLVGIPQEGVGLNFYDKESVSSELGFDDPNMLVDYIAMMGRMVEAGAYPDAGAITEISGNVENDYLVQGEAGMTWVTTNQLNALTAAAGRELKLASVPRKHADGESGTSLRSSQQLSIAANSEVKEEAAKFISFFANDVEANKILNGERGIPIMSKAREAVEANGDPAVQIAINLIDKVSAEDNGTVNTFDSTASSAIEEQARIFVDQVCYGEITAEEAAKAIYEYALDRMK